MHPVFEAYAFRVGNRWLNGHTKKGVVKTAWSLAGAKLFSNQKDADAYIFRKSLKQPKKGVERVLIGITK